MAKGRIGPCALCNNVRKLARAHVIPEAFYRPMMSDGGFAQLVTNREGEFNRRLPTGIYDPDLVCIPCEESFSPYDTYGINVLLHTDWDSLPTLGNGRPFAYQIQQYDRRLLKLFGMSLLWRVAATKRREFHHVDIGPHLEQLGIALRESDPGSVDEWSMMITRFTGRHPRLPSFDARHCFLDPHACRYYGLNFIKIYAAEFAILIKVDSRPLGHDLRVVCIRDHLPLYVMMKDFGTSKELELMWRMSRK